MFSDARNPSADDVWSGAPARPADLSTVVAVAIAMLGLPLALVAAVLFIPLPGLFTWWLGALFGIAIAAGLVLYRVARADAIALSAVVGTTGQLEPPERLSNLVESLTLAGGVVPPEVTLLDDDARNATAIRRLDRNHLVITRGLTDSLDVVELEGAVAELLSRLRNGDAEAATVGTALFGGALLDGPLAGLFGPVALMALGRLLQFDRDLEADRQAVMLTRYPPGLRRALESMAEDNRPPKTMTPGTSHLWLVEPTADSLPDGSRAPLSLRIDVLAEL